MNHLYKTLQAALFCLVSILVSNQELSAQRTLTAHPATKIDAFIGGFYTSLPASYASSGSKTYPLLIFVHGLGEIGDGSAAALPAVLRNGPPMQINNEVNLKKDANFPDPVVVNGKSFEFIVVSPQLNQWPSYVNEETAINDMIAYCQKNYRVDVTKIYMTGLSMGGGVTWDYAGSSSTSKLAGIVVVAGAANSSAGPVSQMVKYHLPVWATANAVDNTVPTAATNLWVNSLNSAGANPKALVNIFPDQGHGGWVKTYGAVNQAGITNSAGLNIYQWMLQYKRSGNNVVIDNGTPAQAPPTVSAGSNQTVTLPTVTAAATAAAVTTAVNLTGAASTTGSITSYQWTQVSGPNTATFGNAKKTQTSVGGLIQGTYVFKFTATDNIGQASSAQVSVVVNAPAPPATVFTVSAGADINISLPASSVRISGTATVQGEAVASCTWTQVSGPNTATISGGTSITPTISNLAAGTYALKVTIVSKSGKTAADQMNLNITASTATTFIANAGPDVTITLPASSWKIAGAVTVKGVAVKACKWTKISGPAGAIISNGGSSTPTVSKLAAGVYVFEMDLQSEFGIITADRMTLTVKAAAASSVTSAMAVAAPTLLDSVDHATLKLYPNPVQLGQQMVIEGQGLKAGTVKFTIYDMSGRMVKQTVLENQSTDYIRQAISTEGLTRGVYILNVATATEKPRQFKFIVQ
jgi:predicted esterase